jgi:hypothetical protein
LFSREDEDESFSAVSSSEDDSDALSLEGCYKTEKWKEVYYSGILDLGKQMGEFVTKMTNEPMEDESEAMVATTETRIFANLLQNAVAESVKDGVDLRAASETQHGGTQDEVEDLADVNVNDEMSCDDEVELEVELPDVGSYIMIDMSDAIYCYCRHIVSHTNSKTKIEFHPYAQKRKQYYNLDDETWSKLVGAPISLMEGKGLLLMLRIGK